MRQRNGSWVMVVGIAMVAYGVAVVWNLLVRDPNVIGQPPIYQYLDRLILAILLAGVGVYGFVKELIREPEDSSPSPLADAVEPYLAGWSRLWRTRWLLWLTGFVAVISALGNGIMSYLAYRHFGLMNGEISRGISPGSQLVHFRDWLLGSLQGAASGFVPSLHLFRGAPLYVLALFCLVWWALPRIAQLSGNSEDQRKGRVLCVALAIAVLAGTVWVALWWLTIRWLWAPPTESNAIKNVSQGLWPLQTLVMTVQIPIVYATLIGGVLGSLAQRSTSNIKTTFLSSAARYFLPLALFWLIVQGLYFIPELLLHWTMGVALTGRALIVNSIAITLFRIVDLIMLLLMFAPFSVVIGGRMTIEAIRDSIELWRRSWRQMAGLAAVGVLLQGFVMLLITSGWLFHDRKTTIWSAPVGAVASILETLVGVLILLSVLEFYQANVRAPEPVSAAE